MPPALSVQSTTIYHEPLTPAYNRIMPKAMPPIMLFKHFQSQILAGVASLAPKAGPTDDWMPTVFFVEQRDAIAADTVFNEFNDKPRLYSEVIPGLIKKHRAQYFGFVFPAWHVDLNRDDIPQEAKDQLTSGAILLAESPYRGEAVMVLTAKHKKAEILYAFITRRPDHPRLGPWRPYGRLTTFADLSNSVLHAIAEVVE